MEPAAGHVVVRRWPRRLVAAGLVVGAVALAFAVALWSTTGSVANLQDAVAARLAPERARPVPYAAIAPMLRRAVVATEDERFYSHSGVDVLGLLRAIPYDLSHATAAQGGSTITEQLAKTIYLGGDDHSPLRKAKDMALALRLESRYSKDQILAAYLNSVYFGDGATGVAAASRRFFATDPAHLTLAQASLLAGLIQAPSGFDPFVHPAAARDRQVAVLRSMVRNHYIGERTGVAVLRRPVRLASGSVLPALEARPDLAPGPTFDVRVLVLGLVLIIAASVVVLVARPRRVGVRAVAALLFVLGVWSTIRSFRVA